MVDLIRARHVARAPFRLPVLAICVASPALAQSFDCSRARPPIETAICASAALRAHDNALAGAFARALYALRDDALGLDALKQAQRRWIVERNRACAADPARLEQCLTGAYVARLGELNRQDVAAARPPQQPSASQPTATHPAAPPAAPAQAQPSPTSRAAAADAAPPVAPGRLEPPTVAADRDASALVTIPAAGRYSLRAKSATGVALQLVDMIAGPGDVAGAAGVRDGRLDLLLDKGVYKLRTTGAKGAAGRAELSAQPWREIAAPVDLKADQPVAGQLGDLEQRSFWVVVGADGRVAVEAAGRALQDLRLWRDGEELADLTPEIATIEAKAGRPMTRVRLEGKVEPGRYLATAYGGESAVWPDGGTDRPFLIRRLVSQSLAAGVFEGAVGPFGSARFEAPANVDSFRLELAEPAAARIVVRRGGETRVATLARNSRDPFVNLVLPAKNKTAAIVEVSGLEGQAFRLRALEAAHDVRLSAPGSVAVFVDTAGEGGDEIPATAVLVRFEQQKPRIVAADMPKVGPGQAWRRRFNLRGSSTILFEATSPGPVAIAVRGAAIRAVIEPVLGSTPPRADGRAPGRYDLDAGVYQLRIAPVSGEASVIDLTLGQPGLAPPVAPSPPARSALSLGVHQIEKGTSLEAIAGGAPNLLVGLRVLPSPIDLAAGPAALWQGLPEAQGVAPALERQGGADPAPGAKPVVHRAAAGGKAARPAAPKSAAHRTVAHGTPSARSPAPPPIPRAASATGELVVQARAPLGGSIAVTDAHGAEIPFTLSGEKTEKNFRVFALHVAPVAAPRALAVAWRAPQPPVSPPAARQPLPTIAAGAPHFFDLADGQRREFRIEARDGGLYKVETLGRLKTRVALGTNFLPRIGEGADNGAGHNGLVQTYLRAGAYRVAVSASESAGRLGLTATPAEMRTTGALAPGGSVRATLADGRGAIAPIEIATAGNYRLDLYALGRDLPARLEDADGWPLTAPGPVRSLDIKLEPGAYRLVVPPVAVDARMVARLTAIPVAVALEGHGPHPLPFGKPQAFQWREPQAQGAARTPDSWTFRLDGEAAVDLSITDGMVGEIVRGEKDRVGKFTKDRPFSGKLAAGDYRVEARALGRDDRLDYTLGLSSAELQPDAPRFVDLPAKLDFAIAADRVVSLTTFGRQDLKGVLRDANGGIVERLQGRADDWNIALSRRLPAGRYSLVLGKMTGEGGVEEPPPETAGDDGEADAERRAAKVEARLALPAEAVAPALAADGAATLSGPQAHVVALPPAPAGSLALVAARSTAELVLSIETRDTADAPWRVAGFARGQAPLLAWPATAAGQWRASVWSIDGAAAPISILARALARRPQAGGAVALERVALDPLGLAVRVGLAQAEKAAIVDIENPGQDFYAGSSPGHVLARADAGPLAPQSDRMWLLSRDAAVEKVAAPALAWKGDAIALALDAGESASLPSPAPASGKARVWRARSAFGQPGLDAGHGMAVAENVAAALGGVAPLRIWNAGGGEALRVDLGSTDVAVLPKKAAGAQASILLPPLSAQPLTLATGDKSLDLDLAAETAAFAAPGEADPLAVYAAGAAASRRLDTTAGEIWLVNLSSAPQPARLTAAPGRMERIAADHVVKRFFGAAGAATLRVDAAKGDVLRVEGAKAVFVAGSGRVLRGGTLTLDGPGLVTLAYEPGLVAAWLERQGASPWPKAQAKPLSAPAAVQLEGPVQSYTLVQDAPALLGVATTAPVILALDQGGRRELRLFAAGADFHRYVAPGASTLALWSPHDGPLGGTMTVTATPVAPVREGIGDAVALAPGASALFGFEVKRDSEIGVGLRADPDRVEARLLDAAGKLVGEGVAQIRKLAPGRYILEARVPADAPASVVRPAVIGLDPPPAGPPAAEIEKYLAAAGLKTNATSR